MQENWGERLMIEFKQSTKKIKECIVRADYIVCLSKDTVSMLRDFYKVSENKLHFIPNGIRNLSYLPFKCKTKIKEELHIHSEDIILLFVGRQRDCWRH